MEIGGYVELAEALRRAGATIEPDGEIAQYFYFGRFGTGGGVREKHEPPSRRANWTQHVER